MLIVIPCLDEAANLPRLLDQFTVENPDALIVVADGGSGDGSRAIVADRAARDPHVVLLDNPERLQAAGINRAVAAHGQRRRWLVRADAHCDYPSDYAGRLIAIATAHEAVSVVVPMVSIGATCFQRAAAAAQNSRLGTGGSPHRHVGQGGYVDHGHHALMALDAFRAAGGYRGGMPANEDAELDQRLIADGGRLWLEPSLALRYHPRATPGALWRQYRGYGRGRALTVRLHRLRLKPRQALPLLVPAAVAILPLAIVTPWAALPAVAWAAACLGAGVVVGARAGAGCALGAGVAAMIMHLAWGIGFTENAISFHVKQPKR